MNIASELQPLHCFLRVHEPTLSEFPNEVIAWLVCAVTALSYIYSAEDTLHACPRQHATLSAPKLLSLFQKSNSTITFSALCKIQNFKALSCHSGSIELELKVSVLNTKQLKKQILSRTI